ncbi:MAG: YitT family protein [[Clostridium] spiroforme]|uniref:YitT family protein n=1 Tax=Thomasclavelia spiroformis TaxID=29348 RepID=A0A943I4A4_9FIRM|nr:MULTISPECIES: YitT family protein [Thomasclavelia]MBS5588487.1 YitT family protein [Thomasclavelia spiroformis]
MKDIKNIIGILIGNTIYALAVAMFILPNNLITGGTTGMALFLNTTLNISVTLFVSIFNVCMFLLGWKILGKKFALTTLISSFYYPFILGVLENIFKNEIMSNDTLLCVIFAGIMIGAAIGLVIRCGASTAGMDIPPLILNKKLGIPISISMYGFDFFILLGQMLIRKREMVFYGILLVLIYTIVLDKVLVIGKSQIQVKIVSSKFDQINDMIINKLDRGSTLIHSETGFMHNKYPIVLTVVNNRELTLLNNYVYQIDSDAFMIINKVNEVRGKGFSSEKKYIQK